MASKQLGKLRQWAGEVISTREKAQPSSEFLALEQEMEMRKKGLEKLHAASREYLEYLSQKKQTDAAPGETITQSEALGFVMIGHGEELGDASALGRSLASYGRARCRIATIQNVFAVTVTDTFVAYLERSKAKLDEYSAQRKKLESRRLAYDAAITKAEKTYKKEKDKKEAEEELARARARYEETAEDVTTRMDAIREGEVDYQRELKNFLESEINYVQQYLEVLMEVEADWPEPNSYADLRKPTSSMAAPHDFSRSSTRSTDSDTKPAASVASKYGSDRSTRSRKNSALSSEQHGYASDAEGEARSRASSRMSRKTKGSRTPSRVSKRHRSSSTTTVGVSGAEDEPDDVDLAKVNGKHKKSSGSVASWVGDAMSSVMTRNKAITTKNPDIGNFAALGDNASGQRAKNGKHARRLSDRSTKSAKSATSRSGSRTRENGRGQRKVMKAVYDFSGGSDELSFKAGEEIVVINEVLDDWWMGEAGGRKGLFPIGYAVFVRMVDSPPTTSTRFKNASATSILGLSRGKLSSEDVESRRTLVEPSESELSMSEDEHDRDSVDDWHPFRDDQQDSGPPARIVLPAGEDHDLTDGPRPSDSFMAEDEFNRKLSASLAKLTVEQQAPSRPHSPAVVTSVGDSQPSLPSPSPNKRMPQPPPPRRQTTPAITSGPPPLPVRNNVPSRTHSSNAALHSLAPPVVDRRPYYSGTSSPFESQSDSSFDVVATTNVTTVGKVGCMSCGCSDFVEGAFRGRGLCANCTHEHI